MTISCGREEEFVGAKNKLNSANLLGTLLVAGLFGGMTGSLTVFMIAWIALLAAAFHAGDIRR
jgi:hypothetical protein